jgi:hypothetical protein
MKGGSEGRAGDRSRPRCAKGRPEGQAVDRSRPKDVDVERRARAGRPTVSLMSAEYAFPGRRPIGAIRGFRPTAASRDPTAIASRQPTPPLTSHGFGDDLFGRGAPCGDGGRLPGGQKHGATHFDLRSSHFPFHSSAALHATAEVHCAITVLYRRGVAFLFHDLYCVARRWPARRPRRWPPR